MMIFYIFTISIIFQFGTIICRNLPLNKLKASSPCHTRSHISKPYSFNCTHFIECDRGGEVIKACAPETVFDPETGVCNWPYNVPQCTGVFGHQNSIEESSNQYNNKLENTFNPISPSIPGQSQWNTHQNQQLINNNQQPAEFSASPFPLSSQYGNQNPRPQPNRLTTGNGNNDQNNLIIIPASTTQFPYYDPSQKLIFSGEQSVSSENQQNGNRNYGPKQKNNNALISFPIDNSNGPGNKPNTGQSNPGQLFVNNNPNYLSANYEKQSTVNKEKYPVSQSGYQHNYDISKPSKEKKFTKLEPMPFHLSNESPSKLEKMPQPQKNNNQYLSNGDQPVEIVFKEYQKDGEDFFEPQLVDQSQQNNRNHQSIHNGPQKGYEYKEILSQKKNFSEYVPQVQSNDRFLPVNYKPDYKPNLVDLNKNKNHQFNQIDSKNNNKQSENIEEDDDGRGDIDIRIEKSNKNSHNSISN